MSSYSNSASRSGSIASARRGGASHSGAPHSRSSSIDHQHLLTPVVRSKRTSIACTECRRRQVKCTGTTPQCERCHKKNLDCEYIPCSQQKAASSGSSSPPSSHATGHYAVHTSSHSAQLAQYPSQQWNQQPYISDPSAQYTQQLEWNRSANSSVQQHHIVHPQAGGQIYGTSAYEEAYPSQGSYSVGSTARVAGPYSQQEMVSHNGYHTSTSLEGYSDPEPSMGGTYAYAGAHQQQGGAQMTMPLNQSGGYPAEYYHAGSGMFDPHVGGMVSTDREWNHPGYPNYQGAPFS